MHTPHNECQKPQTSPNPFFCIQSPKPKSFSLNPKPFQPDVSTRKIEAHKVASQEHRHVLHESAEIENCDEDGEERAPHARPEVEGHEPRLPTGLTL